MDIMKPAFSYEELTTRNFGFVNAEEQEKIHKACIFVCGVGGMGGACLQSLARMGISRFIIADMDAFEVSNLNRQVFATLPTVGIAKTEATRKGILDINPEAKIDIYDGQWLSHLTEILGKVQVVVNGTDDIAAGVQLYRAARSTGIPVIDAYAAALPSVYVTRPGDPTPEERLGYPTRGRTPKDWTPADISSAFLCELEYVMGLSSSRKYIDLAAGAEMAAGKRKRMSFAPMVITTGNLMAYEVANLLIGKHRGADFRGYFFNPYTCKTESPPPAPFAFILRKIAKIMISRLMAGPA
jgi:molybdopterin-synthase adenylyltransferase